MEAATKAIARREAHHGFGKAISNRRKTTKLTTKVPIPEKVTQSTYAIPPGLRLARLTGIALGFYLLVSAPVRTFTATTTPTLGGFLKLLFLVGFAILLLLPWKRIGARSRKAWNRLFAVLAIASAIFVFVIIFETMFDYMDLIETGRKPGLPAFNGTLIFLALMQAPTVLFLRRPDLLR
jgi:hypothetical protein